MMKSKSCSIVSCIDGMCAYSATFVFRVLPVLVLTVFAYVGGDLLAADSDYTAATGYVTMTGNDSSSVTSFNTAGKWSDKKAPHSNTNYYVGASRIFYTANEKATFQGKKLVVAGKVYHNASGSRDITWGDTEFLPGAGYRIGQIAPIRGNKITISGTEESPVEFFNARTSYSSFNCYAKFFSESDASMIFTNKSTATLNIIFKGDNAWDGYKGTVAICDNMVFRQDESKLFSPPGKVIVKPGGRWELDWKRTQPVIGSLKVECGGELTPTQSLDSSHFHITKKLELEAGAYVVCSNRFNLMPNTEPTCMVFRLSADAVAAGIPDLGKVKFRMPNTSTLGRLPRFLPTEMDDTEVPGGKYIGWRKQPVVTMTNLNSGTIVALKPPAGMTFANFWSDGLEPHAGADYIVEKNFWITGKGSPYTFPGESWTVKNIALGIYSNMRDITVPDLSFVGRTIVRPLQDAHFHIRGKLSLFRKEDGVPATVWVANAPDQSVTIHSEIDGENDVMFQLLSGSIASLSGTATLAGLNTNYCGRIIVATTNDTYKMADGSVKSVDRSNSITLNVSDARNLGGRMEEFCYDSLVLSNHCRLAVNESTIFSETTRGWHFPKTAYLSITSGKSAVCKNVFTVGGNLVKEGAGTLSVGAPISAECESARISVLEGRLAACTPDAFAGVSVTISPGASLAIDAENGDERFGQLGLNLSGTTISTVQGGTVGVEILHGIVESWEKIEIPLLTYVSAESKNVLSRFSIRKPPASRGIAMKRVERDNGDGTYTLVACFAHAGTIVSFR